MPNQPLPTLNDTLDLWLTVSKNFLSPNDFEQTKAAVCNFKENEGPKLQAFLQKKANENDSWIHDYWLNGAYLSSRQPIAAYSNYFISHSHQSDAVSQLSRAATLTYWMARLEQLLSTGDFSPVFLMKLVPLCMHGYSFIFNANRIPGENIDELVRHPGHKHIIVIRDSQYYKVDLYTENSDGDKVLLTPLEIKIQFENVIEDAAKWKRQAPVASLTSQNRTTWAQQRAKLLQRNQEVLQEIDHSMFVVALEDKIPEDYADLARSSLLGDGFNTWFDKCLTFTSFANGWVGNNVEHSALDAMVFVNLQEYILVNETYVDGDVAMQPSPRATTKPERLEWDFSDMGKDIETAMSTYKALADDIKMRVLHPPYGKGFMKKQRLSPDGYIQMSLQLTYYRLHRYLPKTYEPSTHRLFLLGRTETVHPASPYCVEWVQAMQDPRVTKSSRRDLLKKAVQSQTDHRLQATVGDGCDRHLMALMCASRELGMDLPRIFRDKAWTLPFQLSTSQTPNNFVEYGSCDLKFTSCVGGFAPSSPEIYGVAYCVLGDDIINFQVASLVSSKSADADNFVTALSEVFSDMKQLFQE